MEEDLITDLVVLHSHMDGMLQRVQKNSVILRRFRSFEMKLLNLDSLAAIIEHILSNAKAFFELDWVSLCLLDEQREIKSLLHDVGFDVETKAGLIFVESPDIFNTNFGYAPIPYIGRYQEARHVNFFSSFVEKPASVAITPIIRRGKYLGALSLGSCQEDRFVGTMATDFIDYLVSIVGVSLENHLNFETIKRTSLIDMLTGVNNRRFFEQRIDEEIDRCQRNVDALSCLFLDIDHFKSINDQYGHQAGDLVLSMVAAAIKTQLRSNDVLARYGGEEFVALLSNIDEAKSLEIGERIRHSIQTLTVMIEVTPIKVTISIGSATFMPGAIYSSSKAIANRLIKAADSALYSAKHQGRNRVENAGVI